MGYNWKYGRCSIRTLKGHTGPVSAVAFTEDGRRLATGADDKTVRLWDVTTGAEARSFAGHTHALSSLAFTRDGQWLASGDADSKVKIWDVATGQERRTLTHDTGPVMSLGFSPDGTSLATGTHHTVTVWDPSTGRERRKLSGHAIHIRRELPRCRIHRQKRVAVGKREQCVVIPEH